jgi:hypothetical protein
MDQERRTIRGTGAALKGPPSRSDHRRMGRSQRLIGARMPARRSVGLAAAVVLAGAVAAGPAGRTPDALAIAWYWARVVAEVLAAGVLLARVRTGGPERLGWAMLALGVVSWTVGDVVHGAGDPYLGSRVPVAAVLWLGCYAAV